MGAMRRIKLYALMITSIVLMLVVVAWYGLLFLFLIIWPGLLFKGHYWSLDLSIALAVPAILIFGAIKVFHYCSRQLPFSALM